MSYTPTRWVDGVTPVNAKNMNNIENGIKANADEVQRILQAIYDQPSSGLDLVICPDEDFRFLPHNSANPTYNVSKVVFDPDAVISAYEKLMTGKEVRAGFTGQVILNSYSPKIMSTYPASRVIAYSTDTSEDSFNYLVVRITVALSYFFLSGDNGSVAIEYRFKINPSAGTAVLDGAAYWSAI